MALTNKRGDNLWQGTLDPPVGELAALWREFGAEVIVGHPTFRNADNIGRQLGEGIAGAAVHFPGRRVCFVVSDGTWTAESGDQSTVEAALAGAERALAQLEPAQREALLVIATPYEGHGGNRVPGKGSALKMIFDEMEHAEAGLLVLLDGDLRNDMAAWQRVFAAVEAEHLQEQGQRPLFVTARYARHFVDASLTRFIVGPLTTLMGRYVPGGISGDIVLSAAAVAHERQSAWSEERLRYGTDISTTFDNVADPETVIYEVFLGAKLHDITDEGKLSVMPGEVIGAALERLLHWERLDGRVSRRVRGGTPLEPLVRWGPDRTGIDFVDPGTTDVFDVDVKIATLLDRFDGFADDIRRVQGEPLFRWLEEQRRGLESLRGAEDGPLAFLHMDADRWLDVLHRAVAYALERGEVEAPKRCLNYLYTAAFLEFVRERLADLGLRSLGQIRVAQGDLGVPAAQAKSFYAEHVDAPVDGLAQRFYEGRKQIAEHMAALRR